MEPLELWSVPVPVRPSTFVAAAREHARYNVEVDLAQIVPRGFERRRSGGTGALLSDLQSSADGHMTRRLGSRRSGYFQGKYLKGMGRTQLAASWLGSDRHHSSGHLLATGAARELLVSAVLEAVGGSATINRCEAVLARELPDPDTRWLAELRGPNRPPCRADRRLQAITVKQGGFARLSNFLWALENFGLEPTWLANYFLAVRRSLGGDPGDAITKAEVTPGEIAQAFAAAFRRGLENFSTYRRLGIDWGSYHNNFTADGRILDLEVPLVLGQPFLGWVSRSGADPRRGKWLGMDAGSYVRHMRDFVIAYRTRLQALPTHLFSDPAVEFLRELLYELDAVFPAQHILFDVRALADHLVASLAAEWNMSAAARRDTAIMVEDSLLSRGHLSEDSVQELDLRELPQRFQPAEVGPDLVLHAPASLLDHIDLSFSHGSAFDAVTRACDQAASLGRFFDALARGKVTLAAIFEPDAAADVRDCASG